MQLNELAKICDEHCFLVRQFLEQRGDDLLQAAGRVIRCLEGGHKILLFGNGGSAADAQHIAAEFVGRFARDRPGLPAIALATDGSVLTSISNDFGFDAVFARQIEALGSPGDVAIAISTSGVSENVIEGLRAARNRGLYSIALLGRDGGQARELADLPLVVAAEKTERIQEVHGLIGHILCEAVERRIARAD
jgi:D-sedoheptulose 7-phosphate isomerase